MAQNQPTSAVAVIPSDTIKIPQSGIITSGTNTSAVATTLTDAGNDFLPSATNPQGYNIRGGDVVVSAAGVICEIESVDDANNLTLLAPGIAAGGYEIYKGNYTVTDGFSKGYSLYVGTGGALAVITVEGNSVILTNVGNASFIPLQVQRVLVTGTTAADILALQ